MHGKTFEPVIVSGLGVVSALGCDIDRFWNNLCAGTPGYRADQTLIERGVPFKVAGRIADLPSDSSLETVDRATRLALNAAEQALSQAGLTTGSVRPPESRIGVVMGTTCGANDRLEHVDFDRHWFSGQPAGCPDQAFEGYDHAAIANHISRHFRFDGPSFVVGTACASGNHALGEAFNMINNGQADIMVCGGVDAFTLLPVFGFYATNSLAQERCTPFDRNRTGMILGEAAAALVLESEASARARGVVPLARLKAWSINCDARNFASPLESGERYEELVLNCLQAADLEPAEIDYINAHGTGTLANDLMEARGLCRIYGESPQPRVPVSSVKGQLGHTLGAGGALEGVISTLAVVHGRIPANTPVGALDQGFDFELVTAPLERPLSNVLSLSFGFGGCNVATLFGSP